MRGNVASVDILPHALVRHRPLTLRERGSEETGQFEGMRYMLQIAHRLRSDRKKELTSRLDRRHTWDPEKIDESVDDCCSIIMSRTVGIQQTL